MDSLNNNGGWLQSDGSSLYVSSPNKYSGGGWSTDTALFVGFVGGGTLIGYGAGALMWPGKETPTERLVSGGGRGAAIGAGIGLVIWGGYKLAKAIF